MAEDRESLALINQMPTDERRFVEGLAAARPLEDLAAELGWTVDKARRLARSSRLLTAVAMLGIELIHREAVPAAIRTTIDILNGSLKVRKSGKNANKSGKNATESDEDVEIVQIVPPNVRLAAAQTIFKIAGLEHHRPPGQAETELSDMTPEQLRGVLGAIEAKLAEGAAPVNAPVEVEEAEVIEEIASIPSILD